MIAFSMRWLSPVALCVVALTAAAQTAPAAGRKPDPLDAAASVPAVDYESSLSQYRRMAADKAIPWRESNDTAARIGGWRAYAREAQQPDPTPPATPARPSKSAPMAMPVPQSHGGHKMP